MESNVVKPVEQEAITELYRILNDTETGDVVAESCGDNCPTIGYCCNACNCALMGCWDQEVPP